MIRGVVGRLIGALYSMMNSIRWRYEAYCEKRKIAVGYGIDKKFDGVCLILIPHSDDEWIGCSRIITNNKKVILCNMDMNGGDSESVHSLRFSEMQMAANCFKHKIITLKSDKKHALANLINETNPDFIFLPHYIDWHPEHIEVMKLLASSLENINTDRMKIVMYQVSCPILSGITHALPMTKKEWGEKWAFFKEHYPTQLYISHQRFSLNEVINGKYINSFAAEVYCSVSPDSWLKLINDSIPNKERRDALRQNLESISKMRDYISSVFV